jgi:hypothetical protein
VPLEVIDLASKLGDKLFLVAQHFVNGVQVELDVRPWFVDVVEKAHFLFYHFDNGVDMLSMAGDEVFLF